MADDWRPVRVAIFGLGQVGTMLGLVARSHGVAQQILVADPDPRAIAASRARGLEPDGVLDSGTADLDADVIVLAAPVTEIVGLVGLIGPRLRPGQLLIDTGSTKEPVVEAMRGLPPEVHAIGGHPLAGTEVPGPAGASPEALAGAPFALTPARDDHVALARAVALVESLGARPVVLDAREHDRVIARTSHLPHVVSYALAAVVRDSRDPEWISELSGTGLRGATRLAASDPAMVAAFLSANRSEVKSAVAELREALTNLEQALDKPAEDLASTLAEAARPDPETIPR